MAETFSFQRNTRRVLLVGGPKHGDSIIVPAEQREIIFASTSAYACYFKEYQPLQETVTIRNEHYRMMLESPDVFEHESLWDANVERAAKRLDTEIARLGQVHNAAKADRLAAERREQRILDDLTRVWGERDQIRMDHGV